MPVTDQDIIAAIEEGLWMSPDIPGKFESIEIAGLRGRQSPIPHPLTNSVGLAKLKPEELDSVIQKVSAFFFQQGHPYSWIIGPNSEPSNLTERLGAAGLAKRVQFEGLVYRDIAAPFPYDPEIIVREATPEDTTILRNIVVVGFGFPEPVAELFSESWLYPSPYRMRPYLAYIPGSDTPGAMATATYAPSSPIFQLSGAATLPEARGKGLYSALVARRLMDAAAAGLETAVIQASHDTSAPILRKRGFERLCGLEMWIGAPQA